MKKLALLLTIVAVTLFGVTDVQAQQSQRPGQAARSSSSQASDSFSWGIAIGGLAVIGVVVGLIVHCASSSGGAFHH